MTQTRRRLLWAMGVAVVIAAATFAVQDVIEDPARPVPGSAATGAGVGSGEGLGSAPDIVLDDLRESRSSISLQQFRGTPLVVNFFAAWCAPCREEMPAFQSVSDAVKGRVQFLGIDNRDIRRDGLDLARDAGARYPLAFDPRGEAAQAFGVIGMPTTVFVSADGQIVARVTGAMSRHELRATVRRLFGI